MAASASDYFIKTTPNFSTTIGSGGVASAIVTTIPLSSVTNLPTDTAIEITINRIDTDGDETNNYETVRGIISGSNLIDCVRGVEGTAQAWNAGIVVEVLVTADIQNRNVTGILVEHNQSGAHKGTLVTTLKATAAEVTTGTDDTKIVTPKGIKDATGITLTSPVINTPTITTPTIRNYDGWIDAAETWTYASASTITVPSGAASKYAVGDRIKWTQTTVKYGVITEVADTLLTIAVNTDYVVTNAAITNNYYSHEASPIGYPHWFNYSPTLVWTAGTAPSGSPSVYNKFKIDGSSCTVDINHFGYTAGATVTAVTISLPVNPSVFGCGSGSISSNVTPNLSIVDHSTTLGRLYCSSVSADRMRFGATYAF